jgi:hypothetical protein
MGVRKCTALTKTGKRCTVCVVGNTNRCAFHTERIAVAARSKGGRSGRYQYPSVDLVPGPTSPKDSMEMISTMMAEVRAGQLDPAIANAARGLHVVFLKAYEDNYIMAEMAKLESKYGLEVAATLPEEQEPSEIDRPS